MLWIPDQVRDDRASDLIMIDKIQKTYQENKILESTKDNLLEWIRPTYNISIQGIPVHDQIEKWLNEEAYDLLNDAFFQKIKPGTAGVRGHLGIGSNRINDITLGLFVEGHARYLVSIYDAKSKQNVLIQKSVVLAYDPREGSYDPSAKGPGYLVKMAASIYVAHGFKVYIFDGPAPTPELSFSVSHLHCLSGAVFTASHNPSTDNGFKPYDESGQQLLGEDAEGLNREVSQISDYSEVKQIAYEQSKEDGLIQIVGKELDDAYIRKVLEYGIHLEDDLQYDSSLIEKTQLKIAFTPLHGTASRIVPQLLMRRGILEKNILSVSEQMEPNGSFPTAKKPNPEEDKALEQLRLLAEKEKVDLAVANDPDADRVAVLVPESEDKNSYCVLNGNLQMAVIADYLLSQLKQMNHLNKNYVFWKSVVSSDLIAEVGKAYGVLTVESRVGFKFAGDKMKEYVQKALSQLDDKELKTKIQTNGYSVLTRNEKEKLLSKYARVLLFGGEESYGANRGDVVRDKDGCAIIDMFVEIAGFYKKKGTSIYDRLCGEEGIFATYGYFKESTASFETPGAKGAQLKQSVMNCFSQEPLQAIAEVPVVALLDFNQQKAVDVNGGVLFDGNYKSDNGQFKLPNGNLIHTFNDLDGKNLGKENFLEYVLQDGSRIIIRPSGTEPKIKLYVLAKGSYSEQHKVDQFVQDAQNDLIQKAKQVSCESELL